MAGQSINIIQKTLVIIKPDGVSRGLVGDIVQRFEKVGLKIIAMKLVKVDEEFAFKHYGQSDDWFEKVGSRTREFYQKVGYDPGEDFNKISNADIGKMVQKWNTDYLTEGVVLVFVLKGLHAIEIVRKIIGPTYPNEAMPGTIRGDYSSESPLSGNVNQRSVKNVMHASSSAEDAEKEIQLWFKESEIFDN